MATERADLIAQALFACLESVDSPEGRKHVTAYLERQPFPHYRPLPEKPGLLERISEDGTRTVGRFVEPQIQTGSGFQCRF